jgi:hypothetical protein
MTHLYQKCLLQKVEIIIIHLKQHMHNTTIRAIINAILPSTITSPTIAPAIAGRLNIRKTSTAIVTKHNQ